MNIIKKANELIEEKGKDMTIVHFQVLIEELGKPKDFGEQCKLAGYQTAIDWVMLGEEEFNRRVLKDLED